MANIKQQKKRIGIARRQRLENLRYRSTAKTLLRNLQDAVNLGDKELAASTHKSLVSLLDRAVTRNVLHRNTAARKKARAARVLVSEPVKEAKVVRRAKKKVQARKPKAEASTAAAEKATKKPAAKKPAAKKPAAAKAAAPEAAVEETTAPEAVVEATPAAEAPAEDTAAVEAEAAPAEDAPAEDAEAPADEA